MDAQSHNCKHRSECDARSPNQQASLHARPRVRAHSKTKSPHPRGTFHPPARTTRTQTARTPTPTIAPTSLSSNSHAHKHGACVCCYLCVMLSVWDVAIVCQLSVCLDVGCWKFADVEGHCNCCPRGSSDRVSGCPATHHAVACNIPLMAYVWHVGCTENTCSFQVNVTKLPGSATSHHVHQQGTLLRVSVSWWWWSVCSWLMPQRLPEQMHKQWNRSGM